MSSKASVDSDRGPEKQPRQDGERNPIPPVELVIER
jgi:hypothetical protein